MKFLVALSLLSLGLQANNLQKKIDQTRAKHSKNQSVETQKRQKEFARATQELKDSQLEENALGTGVKVPGFKLGAVRFSQHYKKKPIVLKFYRGRWCPYCMLELQEYEKLQGKIKDLGGEFIALVPDTAEIIAKTKRDFGLSFPIYRDQKNRIAKKFGLRFRVDPKVIKYYKEFGIDLEASQGNKRNELPMPGTYVINQEGVIVYSFFDADYTKRANPQDVIKVLAQLRK